MKRYTSKHKAQTTVGGNRYKVLQEDINNITHDNTVVNSISSDVKIEDLVTENAMLKGKVDETNECFEVEKMTVNTLTAFITSLCQEESDRKQQRNSQNVEQEEIEATCEKVSNVISCKLKEELVSIESSQSELRAELEQEQTSHHLLVIEYDRIKDNYNKFEILVHSFIKHSYVYLLKQILHSQFLLPPLFPLL